MRNEMSLVTSTGSSKRCWPDWRRCAAVGQSVTRPSVVRPAELSTVDEFVMGMLGFRSRVSCYRRVDQPGWPQSIVFGGERPMLKRADGKAYVEAQADLADTDARRATRLRTEAFEKQRVRSARQSACRGAGHEAGRPHDHRRDPGEAGQGAGGDRRQTAPGRRQHRQQTSFPASRRRVARWPRLRCATSSGASASRHPAADRVRRRARPRCRGQPDASVGAAIAGDADAGQPDARDSPVAWSGLMVVSVDSFLVDPTVSVAARHGKACPA